MSDIALIAALDRELATFVKGWTTSKLTHGGRSFSCCQKDELVAVVCGIGAKNAEIAARGIVEKFRPRILISAGVAGALNSSLKVGNVVLATKIIDAASGAEYNCTAGADVKSEGVLVTAPGITGADAKRQLSQRFHALAVDMEAAGVARVAHESGVEFRCVKAISDEAGFSLPPLSRFIDAEGNFHTGSFLFSAALHPQHWASIRRLGRNTRVATSALCDWLRSNLNGSLKTTPLVKLENRGVLKD